MAKYVYEIVYHSEDCFEGDNEYVRIFSTLEKAKEAFSELIKEWYNNPDWEHDQSYEDAMEHLDYSYEDNDGGNWAVVKKLELDTGDWDFTNTSSFEEA